VCYVPAVLVADRSPIAHDESFTLEDLVCLFRRSRPAWHAQAACVGSGVNFFPGRTAQGYRDLRAAKAICATCPVVAECAEAGGGEDGVWGGMAGRERKRKRPPLAERQRRRFSGITIPTRAQALAYVRATFPSELDRRRRHVSRADTEHVVVAAIMNPSLGRPSLFQQVHEQISVGKS